MTKAERDLRIGEAIEWMREDGGKFLGWGEDRLGKEDKVASALLESLLLAYPAIRLIPALAACRAHWIARGPTTRKVWCARIQNWAKQGAEWDPLISGAKREAPAERQAQSGKRIESDATRSAPCAMPKAPCAQPTRPVGDLTPAGEIARGELAKIREKLGG
jgi:hypothetical protein